MSDLAHHWTEANRLLARGLPVEAIAHFETAHALWPHGTMTTYGLGMCALANQDWEPAIRHLSVTVERAPQVAQAWYHLGGAYRGKGDWANAAFAFNRCLGLDSWHVSALIEAGHLLMFQGATAAAYGMYERAIATRPLTHQQRYAQSLIRLWTGDYARGWRDYEARWSAPFVMTGWRRDDLDPAKRWLGTTTERLLVYAEQGMGDAIMMSRFLPLVATRASRIVFQVHKSLTGLMHVLPVDEIIGLEDPAPTNLPHVPLMSLPLVLGLTSPKDIPPATDFQIPKVTGTRTLGICYAGGAVSSLNLDRSAPREAFDTLRQLRGWTVIDFTNRKGDWLETARDVACCDAVVSVDTALAHLSGSLGIPTALIPPTHAEWRWLRGKTTSPWYPGHRLYHREKSDAWGHVIDEIVQDLEGAALYGGE